MPQAAATATPSLSRAAETTPLLLLGRKADPQTERGVICPGVVPDPADPSLVERARAAREALGDSVYVLGHHYQRDEVIQFADVRGDSFKLARDAAANGAPYVVDRKSTRLNSSHVNISYAVFCLKKKKDIQ